MENNLLIKFPRSLTPDRRGQRCRQAVHDKDPGKKDKPTVYGMSSCCVDRATQAGVDVETSLAGGLVATGARARTLWLRKSSTNNARSSRWRYKQTEDMEAVQQTLC